MSEHRAAFSQRLAVSIEVTAKQSVENDELADNLPKGVWVYLADIGRDSQDVLVKGARRLTDLGLVPVPHLVARRYSSRDMLEERIKALTGDAGVRNVLVVGGSVDRPAGPFASATQLLRTGLLDMHGVTEIGVAGHPEGSPDFSDEAAIDALRLKCRFAEETDARMRIVTQFAFSSDAIVGWIERLGGSGVDLPVHVGIAGPTKLMTLMKYASACGVGNSIQFLRRQARSVTALATGYAPDHVADPIEAHKLANRASLIEQLHVFPFGGVSAASTWIRSRGSWPASNGFDRT